MEHIVTETGELQIKRTAYMQWLMNATHFQTVINAVMAGSLTGAWEKAIADQLFLDCYADQNPQAFEILELTGDTSYNKETFLKAAKLVINSIT